MASTRARAGTRPHPATRNTASVAPLPGGEGEGRVPGVRPLVADSVLGLIGNTPLMRLRRVTPGTAAQVLAKVESLNPAGSVKDRIALAMVEAVERDGRLQPGATI